MEATHALILREFAIFNSNRGLTKTSLDAYADEMLRVGEAAFLTAISTCSKDQSRQPFIPSVVELRRYLPSTDAKAVSMAWWSTCGHWGGDWSKRDRGRLLEIAVYVAEHTEPPMYLDQQTKFLAFLGFKREDLAMEAKNVKT